MSHQSILSKLKGKLIAGIVIGAMVYLVLVVVSDWEKVKVSMLAFSWSWFPLILGLAFANYILRFFKWDYYLGCLDIKISKRESLIIFLSGLVGTITPGKIGELLKSLLLKNISGVEMSRSAPVIVAERLTDFVAIVIISLAGITVFTVGSNSLVLAVVVVVLGLFIGIISQRRLSLWLINIIAKLPVVGRFSEKLFIAYESTFILLKPAPLSVATLWSLAAWMCECVGFWIVLWVLGIECKVLTASFIYAFGTMVGVVSPGGLGVTDGSMVGMLQSGTIMGQENKVGMALAAAATMIVRIATLWFAVFVGIVTLGLFQKRFSGVSQALDKKSLDI